MITDLPKAMIQRDRHAFTLIELLVVIAVMAILASIMLPALSYARTLARGTVTAQRCEDIQRAFAQLGTSELTTAQNVHLLLKEQVPTFPGITRFKRDAHWGEYFPRAGDWIAPPYPTWCWPHPWGKAPTDFPGDAPTALPAITDTLAIEAHGLSELTPRFTVDLMTLAGTLEYTDPVQTYRSNRSKSSAWNDGWGNPLVIGLAMYHPRENTLVGIVERASGSGGSGSGGQIRQDLFHKRAQEAYNYTKAFYTAVGSIGPKPAPPLTETQLSDASADWDDPNTGILIELWRQINALCNADSGGNDLWTSAGERDPFTLPAWTGVKRGKQDGRIHFLTSPQELR